MSLHSLLRRPHWLLTIILILACGQGALAGKTENAVYRAVLNSLGKYGYITRASYPKCMRSARAVEDRIKSCLAAVAAAQKSPLGMEENVLTRVAIYQLFNRNKETNALIRESREALKDSLDYHIIAARLAMNDRTFRGQPQRTKDIDFHLGEAERIAKDSLRVKTVRASEALVSDRSDEAMALFTEVIEHDPRHVYALTERARIHLGREQYTAALADLNQAVDADRTNTLPRARRGRLLNRMGKFEQAVEDFDVVLQKKPHSQMILVGRATALFFAGHKEAALADLNRLLNKDRSKSIYSFMAPDRAALLLKRALILRDLGHDERAAEDIVQSLRIGDRPNILRVQVFLRRRGFMEVKINGRVSLPMKKAVRTCFAKQACVSELRRKL